MLPFVGNKNGGGAPRQKRAQGLSAFYDNGGMSRTNPQTSIANSAENAQSQFISLPNVHNNVAGGGLHQMMDLQQRFMKARQTNIQAKAKLVQHINTQKRNEGNSAMPSHHQQHDDEDEDEDPNEDIHLLRNKSKVKTENKDNVNKGNGNNIQDSNNPPVDNSTMKQAMDWGARIAQLETQLKEKEKLANEMSPAKDKDKDKDKDSMSKSKSSKSSTSAKGKEFKDGDSDNRSETQNSDSDVEMNAHSMDRNEMQLLKDLEKDILSTVEENDTNLLSSNEGKTEEELEKLKDMEGKEIQKQKLRSMIDRGERRRGVVTLMPLWRHRENGLKDPPAGAFYI